MQETLVLVIAVLAVPLLLLLLWSAFAWRYRRMLHNEMSRSTAGAGAASYSPAAQRSDDRPSLTISTVQASAVRLHNGESKDLDRDARVITRRVGLAFTAAAIVYSAIASTTMAMAFAPRIPVDARVVAVYLSLACVLLIVGSVLSLRFSRLAALVGGYLAIGLGVLLTVVDANRAIDLIGAEALLFFILPAIGLALLLVQRLRPLLVALTAVLLYIAISAVVAIFLSETTTIAFDEVRPLIWALGIFNFIAGIVILGWLLGRRSVRGPVGALVAAGIIGLIIEFAWRGTYPIGWMLAAVPMNVFLFFLVWLVFRATVWLQDLRVLPAQVLQSHIAFAFLSMVWMAMLGLAPALFTPGIWPVASIAAAFGSYLLVLHVLLYRVWSHQAKRSRKRLLFLRAFGSTRRGERLLRGLEDTWRRIGRIDLIAGTDLGVHALSSRMIEAFLVRRADAQFLKTQQEVTDRLQRLRSDVEGDGRYPINEIYCYTDTWQTTVSSLAPAADAVLMDLREFSRRNRGCVFELTELLRRVPLRHVVLLADRTTDMTAVEEVARTAWAELPSSSPNAIEPRPQLRILEWNARRGRNEHALVTLLLDASTVAEPDAA